MLNFIKTTTLLTVIVFFFIVRFDVNEAYGDSLQLTVAIDAGHGGYDGGAEGKFSKEKDINLKIALSLRNYLESFGIDVLMVRETDIAFNKNVRGSKKRSDLEYRINYINESNADLFVSIHTNAMSDSRWRGAQTFYYPLDDRNKALAENIQTSIIDVLNNTHRKAKGIKTLYLFKHIDKVGVLIECGFLSNPEEEQLLQDADYQDRMAYAIYLGIVGYLSKN